MRPNWDADDDLKSISGDDIENKTINILTLRERLILGQFIFWLAGIHLDQDNIILTGSRNSDGDVLCVNFVPGIGDVDVGWYDYDVASDDLRFRQKFSVRNPI